MNKDCFASTDRGCAILKSGKCPDKRCKFHKTHQRLRLEQSRAYDRLMNLGRLALIDTYQVEKR